MSNYHAGHQSYLYYAEDTATITESPDGNTPASFGAKPASPVLVGYIDSPQIERNENTKQIWGAGSPSPATSALGGRNLSQDITIRVGNTQFISDVLAGKTLALFTGKTNENGDGYGQILRYAVPGTFVVNFSESTEAASEVSVQIHFEGQAWQDDTTKYTPSLSDLQSAGGDVLTWNHVYQLEINGTDYRAGIKSISLTQTQNLERVNSRPDWNDNVDSSRTSYEVLKKTKFVSGELTFFMNLERELFVGAGCATKWGDIVITCNNAAACHNGSAKYFNLTCAGARPVSFTQQGGDVDTVVNFTIPFLANTLTLDTAGSGSGSGSG